MSSFTYSSRACARLARHVVTVAILGAAGWLQGGLQLFALSPKALMIENTSVVAVYQCVVVIWPLGCDVILLIVVAACCFAIHSTSALVAKARG